MRESLDMLRSPLPVWEILTMALAMPLRLTSPLPEIWISRVPELLHLRVQSPDDIVATLMLSAVRLSTFISPLPVLLKLTD